MPTITQLPPITSVNPSDELPLSQNGVTGAVSVGTLLAGTQPAILAPTGSLLGRNSLGAGTPEPVIVGNGLLLDGGTLIATAGDVTTYPVENSLDTTDQAVVSDGGNAKLLPLSMLRGLFTAGANIAIDASGTISANAGSQTSYSISDLQQTATIAATDLVGISQGGADRTITLANFLEGETIDQGAPAAAAADTDTFWVGQGSSTMLAQTFGALWTWIATHLPGWKRPVVEVATTTQLDASIHNNAILVCSQAVTINPAFATQGSGFTCTIINASSGAVTLGAGFTSSSGALSIPVGQVAHISATTYSGGNLNFAEISGGGTGLAAPGQVTNLAVGTVTSNSVALSWSAPSSGGLPSSYAVSYRVTGASTWSSVSATGTSVTVSGLTAGTRYDFDIAAQNASGIGPASAIVNATTGAATAYPPNLPTGVAIGTATSSTLLITWTAPATDASHGGATSYTVQWRQTGTSTWMQQSGVSATGYTIANLIAATEYDIQVQAVNSAGSSSFTATVNGTTGAATAYPPNVPSGVAIGTSTSSTLPITWTAPATDPSHSAATYYVVQWRQTGTSSWTQQSGISATSYTITGLTAQTQYDIQVQAGNAAGSSAFTATVNASTATAGPGNYAMGSGFQPYGGGTSYPHGSTNLTANVTDMSASVDGGHTVPAQVYFGWTQSATQGPTSLAGLSAAQGQFTNGGHNYWYSYNATTPTTPGTYYFWAVEVDSNNNIVASAVQTNQVGQGGTPVAFTIT